MPTTWQHDFFRGIALDCWRAVVPNLPTSAEADYLANVFLAGSPGEIRSKHLLDLACGNGRHALDLAVRGFNVTGVDLSEEFVVEAQSRASQNARFIQADMLDLQSDLAPATGFDGAYCFGNAIGHFDRGDLQMFLAGVSRLLKPGAAFVVDTGMAAESILVSLPRGRWFRFGDMFMLSEHRYQALEGRFDIDYTFVHRGPPVTHRTSSFVFTLAELSRLFAEAGLATESALSSPAGEPFTAGSPRLLFHTRRV
jgi:SAM-dependent methyltransferase